MESQTVGPKESGVMDMDVETEASAPTPAPAQETPAKTAATKDDESTAGATPMEVDGGTEGATTEAGGDANEKAGAGSDEEAAEADGDADEKASDDTDEEEEAERKKKAQWALATAGLGYKQAKKRVLHAFENRMWPILEEGGWTTITCTSETNDSMEATYYMPPGVKLAGGWVRNKEYTSVIKQVIDRVLERRNELESRAADAYLDEVGDIVAKSQKQRQPAERSTSRRSRRSSSRESDGSEGGPDDDDDDEDESGSRMTDDEIHHVSLSWKFNERRHFPKLTSRVGDDYQASSLPPAGTEGSSKDDADVHCFDQVFDPAKATEAGVLDFVQNATNIPAPLKEAAMVTLHQRGYKADGINKEECERVSKPLDGSDWTDEEKALFHDAIFEHRKDLKAVAKKMNKSMGNVMTYYLGTYKHSNDYRLLKVVCQMEKEKQEDEVPDNDICRVCREGGHLVVCDGCELAYHFECLKPAIKDVPEGEWNCDYCLDEKLMAARDAIIKQSNLLREEKEDEVKEGKDGDAPKASAKTRSQNDDKKGKKSSKSAAQQQIYSDEMLDAARDFAAAFFNAAATATSQPAS